MLEYDEDSNAISWLRSKARFDADIKAGEIRIIKLGERWSVQFKQRIPSGKTPRSIFTTESVITDCGTTSPGSSDVYEYFKKDVFFNPKPVSLIQFLLSFGLTNNDIVLDFLVVLVRLQKLLCVQMLKIEITSIYLYNYQKILILC